MIDWMLEPHVEDDRLEEEYMNSEYSDTMTFDDYLCMKLEELAECQELDGEERYA